MSDLVEFLRARLDEDEQWALAASKPYRHAAGTPEVPSGGVHWTWVVGDNWEPIIPDPVVDEFVTRDEDWNCNLATVEEWPSENDGRMMPTTYAGTIEEMDAVAARHIARHDPARVLREVEADRKLIAAYIDIQRRKDENAQKFTRMMRNPAAHAEDLPAVKTHGWELGGREEGLRFALMVRAERFADHPDYDEEWKP